MFFFVIIFNFPKKLYFKQQLQKTNQNKKFFGIKMKRK